MPYVVLIHATFANKADADHIYNQAKSVATASSVALIGQAGERTSHCGVYEELPNGSLEPDRVWHLDRFGIVRETAAIPNEVVPEWVQPTGAHDAYPLLDVFGNPTRVQVAGTVWENTAAANIWAPGAYGWVQV